MLTLDVDLYNRVDEVFKLPTTCFLRATLYIIG